MGSNTSSGVVPTTAMASISDAAVVGRAKSLVGDTAAHKWSWKVLDAKNDAVDAELLRRLELQPVKDAWFAWVQCEQAPPLPVESEWGHCAGPYYKFWRVLGGE